MSQVTGHAQGAFLSLHLISKQGLVERFGLDIAGLGTTKHFLPAEPCKYLRAA